MDDWTACLRSGNLVLCTEDLLAFRDMHVRDIDLAERMSQLFLIDLYVMEHELGIHPRQVLDSIRDVETGEGLGGVKPSSIFKHPPLKGLWHKHFFAAPFVIRNIVNRLGRNGMRDIIADVFQSSASPTITKEMIQDVARRITHEPLEARTASRQLTGEWIIYLKRFGRNYYLCINGHDASDQFIYDRIVEHATKDFSDLEAWIREAATSA